MRENTHTKIVLLGTIHLPYLYYKQAEKDVKKIIDHHGIEAVMLELPEN